MNTTQRLIKGLAILLAVFIMVSIAGAVLSAVGTLGLIYDGFERDDLVMGETIEVVGEEGEGLSIKQLDVSVKATRVWVKSVDSGVKYQTNNEYIDVWEENGTIHVVERSHGVFGFGGTGELTIYVSNKVELEEAKFEVGAGTLTVQDLVAKRIDLKLGAGKTEIDYLSASERLRIDSGAGVVEVMRGRANNAEIEIGAGKAELRLELIGDSKVVSGVGKLELELIGAETDYRLAIDKGIGSVSYNGRNLADDTREGNGENVVEIKSGVGAVEIRTVAR